ncbi:MBL fold metallo-hydrolase [Clostridium sp. HCP1S3_B4]|uniref:MBL fold metallo-hydrolase n=1 Tax=unclassified Clostridium TaxID=2614128 RepID=UPI002A7CA7FC|nr:MBL fold metallo-hydrolase [Clostridium sp.]
MIFCSLYSGSSGNSIFAASEKAKILIDAGMPGKRIDAALNEIGQNAQGMKGIFITHEHSDHIKGVGVMSRKYDIPIYANAETWSAMEGTIGRIKEHNIKVIDRRSTIKIEDMCINSFAIPHDAVAPVGYTVECGNKKVSVATDFGTFTEEIKDNIKESEVILLESNHDVSMLKYGPYPYVLKRRILSEIGHLSNDDCGKAIVEISKSGPLKKILLGHLSRTNNNPDLAYQTVLSTIKEDGLMLGKDVILGMADRNNPSGYVEI